MGKLEELEEALYGKEQDMRPRRRVSSLSPSAWKGVRSSWERADESSSGGKPPRMRRAVMFAAAGAAIFLAGAAAFVWWYVGGERHEAEIVIGGRDLVEAGEIITIPITARNISSSALEDADLAIVLPVGSLLRSESGREEPSPPRLLERIGSLAPGEEATREITVRLLGREGEEETVEASLLYRPSALRARFSARGAKNFRISRVPLDLLWDTPSLIVPRQEAVVELRYTSQARIPFEGMWLRIDYPPGFSVRSSDPKPDAGDSLWKIGTLEAGREGKIRLLGVFDGSGGEIRSLHAGLGFFNESTKEWKPWRESSKEVRLSASPFSLEIALNGKRDGVVHPGERVNGVVRYKNRGTVAVKNVSARAYVEGGIADLGDLAIGNGGVFDGDLGAIVWGSGGTERLRSIEPGADGELQFSFATRSRPVMQSVGDKHLKLRVRVAIEAPDIPAELKGSPLSPDDTVELKVATVALFSARAVHRSSPIPNAGPLPPKAGEKTTYAIIWEVRNFTNEIESAEIRVSLPPNIKWENVVFPPGAPVSFDASASETRWRIGRIAPGAGVLTPAPTTAFQVSVTPSEIDAGRALTLAGESRFTGKDGFTVEDIAVTLDRLTLELRDDPLTSAKDWIVTK